LELQASATNAPLFGVRVAYDYRRHDPSKGLTVSMDGQARQLRVNAGVKATPAQGGSSISWGHMVDDLSKDGWIRLYLDTTTSPRVSNGVKMYAAGYLEGLLTAARISQFYSNFYQTALMDVNNEQAIVRIKQLFKDEIDFLKRKTNFHGGAMSEEPLDPYWKHARYLFMQLWGIKDGYNFMATTNRVNTLDLIDMFIINSHGELPELLQAYTPKAATDRKAFQKAFLGLLQKGRTSLPGISSAAADRDWEQRVAKRGRCSALVRLTSSMRDLFVGHTTWSDYGKMTRIFKYYTFRLTNAFTAAETVVHSSYPGCVGSTDDFYMLSSGLAVMDTSLEILNPLVYNRVADFPSNPHLPDFMRVMIANRLARTGAHWVSILAGMNTGTNNAQWMVVDYNLFQPGLPIQDNTLWVMEQVPGLIRQGDLSQHLQRVGYWASYNRPYFSETRELTGHAAAEAQYGSLYSWASGPRATIFQRVASGAESGHDMRSIMNRNNFPSEDVLPSEPGHAVSARMDLDEVNHIPNGGIDAKVTSRCLFRAQQCQAISGPSHVVQPVFAWGHNDTQFFPGWPHLGLPDLWNFDWVQMTPSGKLPAIHDIEKCGR